MPELDIVIGGGHVVTARDVLRTDIGIQQGRIVTFGENLGDANIETIDAAGLHIFPGVIDAHVHFNEPGRDDWEGLETGTRALVAGGGTVFFDMPLNSHPPLLNVGAFDAKRERAARAGADFAFWGGLTPDNLDDLEGLADRGVIGFKAFMCDSGIEEFPAADDQTLYVGMKIAAELGLPVAVHAESDALTRQLTTERLAHGLTSIRDWLESRPIEAELQAIRQALVIAAESKCKLHIVHISCGEGVALVAAARQRGVDVSCETCPHYLTLTEDDIFGLGGVAKCSPPLRPQMVQDDLWSELQAGRINTIGSDHSPSLPEMKVGDDFFKIWGGIAGVQHTLPLLISEGYHKRQLDLSSIARLTSHNVAMRFNLAPEKGGIKIGAEADLAFVDLNAEHEVKRWELLNRHPISPYAGRRLRGQVMRTMIFGRTVFLDGKIVSTGGGRLLKPARNA
ncbi:MAG: allantoinase [Verrucomicrobiota bacterium]|jgi:allantoinase